MARRRHFASPAPRVGSSPRLELAYRGFGAHNSGDNNNASKVLFFPPLFGSLLVVEPDSVDVQVDLPLLALLGGLLGGSVLAEALEGLHVAVLVVQLGVVQVEVHLGLEDALCKKSPEKQ